MGTQNALPKITHVQDFGIMHYQKLRMFRILVLIIEIQKKTPTNNEICYGFSKLFNKVGHSF